MIKINGKEYDIEEDAILIQNLVEKKDIKKIGDEYFWTKKAMKDLVKSITRLRRSLNNPLWKFYYSFFEW